MVSVWDTQREQKELSSYGQDKHLPEAGRSPEVESQSLGSGGGVGVERTLGMGWGWRGDTTFTAVFLNGAIIFILR